MVTILPLASNKMKAFLSRFATLREKKGVENITKASDVFSIQIFSLHCPVIQHFYIISNSHTVHRYNTKVQIKPSFEVFYLIVGHKPDFTKRISNMNLNSNIRP